MKQGTDGWWEGEVNGVYGRFPSHHVRLKKDMPAISEGTKMTQALFAGKASLVPDYS